MTARNELKPCPFCGEGPSGLQVLTGPQSWNGVPYLFVTCEICGAQGPLEILAEEARNKWNIRS